MLNVSIITFLPVVLDKAIIIRYTLNIFDSSSFFNVTSIQTMSKEKHICNGPKADQSLVIYSGQTRMLINVNLYFCTRKSHRWNDEKCTGNLRLSLFYIKFFWEYNLFINFSYVDYVHIMGYDITSADSNVTGLLAPLSVIVSRSKTNLFMIN